MMYVKLILRNVKRSTKEYAIYFMTLVIAIMLMYAFNGVALSNQIQELSRHMDAMLTAMIAASIVIVFVLGWLIYYISNFILQKRSREFGMYMLMGMRRKEVSLMFLLEQLIMGILAMILGCFLGMVVYQVINAVIMNVFQQQYEFTVSFSAQGASLTLLYFALIYILEILRERYYLKKHSIHDMLYRSQTNQKMHSNKHVSIWMFVFGIVFFLAGLKSLNTSMENMLAGSDLIIAIVLLIASIFFLFFGLSYVIQYVFHTHKKYKYKGNRLYLTAQICTRLKTSRMVLALLSILTLATLLLVCIGLKFQETQSASENLMVYDIRATTFSKDTINKDSILDYMKTKHIAYQDHSFILYNMPYQVQNLLKGMEQSRDYQDADAFPYIKYSDYCRLMEILKEKPLSLDPNEYLIISNSDFETDLVKNAKTIDINGLKNKGVDTREIGQSFYDALWIVVPDAMVQGAEQRTNEMYVLKSETPSDKDWVEEIEEPFFKDNTGYISFYIKYDWLATNLSGIVILVFAFIYIALILACVNATVLAIHQMSDVWKQRNAYVMLQKMGVSRKEVYQLLRQQIGIYFFVPFIIPVCYAFFIVAIIDKLFSTTYAHASMIPYVVVAIAFYLTVYICYYFLAYFNGKHSIDNDIE